MTQECLAELVGIHWQTISNIERGKHPFAVTTFAKVAQNLHASADMLLLGIPPVDQAKYKKITKALARRRAVSGK